MFLESICDDPELLAENLRYKIASCPDFGGMSQEEALQDLETRIQKYESRYETIADNHLSYIKVFNLSSRLQVNHIYGRLAKVVLPAIMAWNTGSRPIFLCRAGETKAMEAYMRQLQEQHEEEEEKKVNGSRSRSNSGLQNFEAMSTLNTLVRRMRGDRLGERGLRFRDALCDFIEKEGIEFMNRQNKNVIHPSKMDTGTSISGLYEERDHTFEHASSHARNRKKKNSTAPTFDEPSSDNESTESTPSFPCLVMSSTMPRGIETATWPKHPFHVKDVSNLNPLDMGDFAGMDLATIRELHPEWYEQLKREPFHTRYVPPVQLFFQQSSLQSLPL